VVLRNKVLRNQVLLPNTKGGQKKKKLKKNCTYLTMDIEVHMGQICFEAKKGKGTKKKKPVAGWP
jgi:hypothetical protein